MIYTVDNTTATSATLSNLQYNTEYTVWVLASGGQINRTSVPRTVSLPARGMCTSYVTAYSISHFYCSQHCTTSAPPTPTGVTAEAINASSFWVAWQWDRSGLAPSCFNTTHVAYCPEGSGRTSLQLIDPAANETTLTDLQNNTCYTITLVATAGEHRREGVARTVLLPQQGIPISCGLFIQYTCCIGIQ